MNWTATDFVLLMLIVITSLHTTKLYHLTRENQKLWETLGLLVKWISEKNIDLDD